MTECLTITARIILAGSACTSRPEMESQSSTRTGGGLLEQSVYPCMEPRDSENNCEHPHGSLDRLLYDSNRVCCGSHNTRKSGEAPTIHQITPEDPCSSRSYTGMFLFCVS